MEKNQYVYNRILKNSGYKWHRNTIESRCDELFNKRLYMRRTDFAIMNNPINIIDLLIDVKLAGKFIITSTYLYIARVSEVLLLFL